MPQIKDEDLVIHILNVGFGDNILIEFPADSSGERFYGLVDCYKSDKTKDYIEKLSNLRPARSDLEFICATHPHMDHIAGISSLLTDPNLRPRKFWDSGFRHKSKTYEKILNDVMDNDIRLLRVSAGMEWYFGRIRITALAPSIALRNRYATYGIDMNNASIVLRVEHHKDDVILKEMERYKGRIDTQVLRQAGKGVVILGGDAEFDSWAKITEDFPKLEKTKENEPMVKKMVNYLSCGAVKISHHGSMHSSPLDIYEKMSPGLAIASTRQTVGTKQINGINYSRNMFPHDTTSLAIKETGADLITTDGSYESEKVNGQKRNPDQAHEGSIIIKVSPGGVLEWTKMNDDINTVPDPINSW